MIAPTSIRSPYTVAYAPKPPRREVTAAAAPVDAAPVFSGSTETAVEPSSSVPARSWKTAGLVTFLAVPLMAGALTSGVLMAGTAHADEPAAVAQASPSNQEPAWEAAVEKTGNTSLIPAYPESNISDPKALAIVKQYNQLLQRIKDAPPGYHQIDGHQIAADLKFFDGYHENFWGAWVPSGEKSFYNKSYSDDTEGFTAQLSRSGSITVFQDSPSESRDGYAVRYTTTYSRLRDGSLEVGKSRTIEGRSIFNYMDHATEEVSKATLKANGEFSEHISPPSQ